MDNKKFKNIVFIWLLVLTLFIVGMIMCFGDIYSRFKVLDEVFKTIQNSLAY